MTKFASFMKIGKMFKVHEERDLCMKGNGSLDDARPSCKMELILGFELILTFVEEQVSKNFQYFRMFVLKSFFKLY